MIVSHLNLKTDLKKEYVLAVISDLHNQKAEVIIRSLTYVRPDYIAVNGDLLYAVAKGETIYKNIPISGQHFRYADNALSFLREAKAIAPVILSTGNHELYLDDDDRLLLNDLGIILLEDSYTSMDEFVFGGLSSPYKIFAGTGVSHSRDEHKRRWKMVFENVNTSWLDDFESQDGYKILLCHHPEFYEPFLKGRKGIDLILSGHAHGGQIRLFGQGIFAYGQGWFPKYTKGLYDGKLLVSSGLSNTSLLPRIGNPKELIYVHLIQRERFGKDNQHGSKAQFINRTIEGSSHTNHCY